MSTDILDLGGRVSLVTGAGQGLGEQIAKHLAGATNSGGVVVNDYFLDRAEAVAEEIQKAGGNAIAMQGDVTDFEGVKEIMAKTKEQLGPIGVLINNAGNRGPNPTAETRKPFWEVGPDVWNQSIGVNFYGVINCVSAAIPDMIERDAPGRIVTIISDASRFGDSGLEVYAGAKAGAAGFMRGVARTLARYNITANCISISATETPATAERLKKAPPELIKKTFQNYIVRRPGKPHEIANMALFLASDASSYISGQTYPVNGGFTLAI